MLSRHWIRLLWALLTVAFVSACATQLPEPNLPSENSYQYDNYSIGIGDSLSVHVWRNPDLSQVMIVRPDGMISLPLIGDLRAAGKQPEALAAEIASHLGEMVRNPEVTVSVTNPASLEYLYRVRITGQVQNPISVPFQEGMRVIDLLMMAGGLTDFAAGNRALLSRLEGDSYQTYQLYLDELISNGVLRSNILLMPNDVISVPSKSLWKGEF